MIGPPEDYVFLISSAINATRGIYSPQERFQQTLKTVESVKEKVPRSVVILFDSTLAEDIKIPGLDLTIRLSDPTILDLNRQQLNSPAEALSLYQTLITMKQHPSLLKILDSTKRLFKISGRYWLSSSFDISFYDNTDLFGKYVFKDKLPTWLNDDRKILVDHLLITRLWSFCPSLLGELLQTLPQVFETCMKHGLDLEHSMYRHMNQKHLYTVPKIGVAGPIAVNSEITDD